MAHQLALAALAGVAALALLLLVGVIYQALGNARDAHRYPPPGRLVDVGGHRLHLVSAGQGQPTVILDAGLPGTTLSWTFVHPEVAQFTRVCSFERAGLGWSDAGPLPRTSQQIVAELAALLHNAGIPGPYILVGHSFGAFTARLFARLHPEEVAGLVLLDPTHPAEWLRLTEHELRQLRRGAAFARYGGSLARVGVARLIASLVRAGAFDAARRGVAVVTGGVLREPSRLLTPVARLPAELRAILRVFWTQPKFFSTMASQIESLPVSAAQLVAAGDPVGIPLVVLTASDAPLARREESERLARAWPQARHTVVPGSGHWVQLDRPDAVVEAIREVVELAWRRAVATSRG